jgi:hypothetical protein
MKRELHKNLSGNEVYYTNSIILLVKNVRCSKIHYKKGFNSIPFLYEGRVSWSRNSRVREIQEPSGFGSKLRIVEIWLKLSGLGRKSSKFGGEHFQNIWGISEDWFKFDIFLSFEFSKLSTDLVMQSVTFVGGGSDRLDSVDHQILHAERV